MLTLITGQPGNGKTLYAISTVEKQRQAEGRAVYYNGIGGLTLPWTLVSAPDQWEKCPDSSIFVCDEAWRSDPRAFGKRGTMKAPPSYVEALATHRHRGFDIYLITQSASQIDPFVRALVGRHIHLDRKLGAEQSTVWQWDRVGDPTSNSDKREGLSSRWTFPAESYGWYTSAVEHTHKRVWPWKLMLKIGVASLVFLAVVGFLVHRFWGMQHPKGSAPGASPLVAPNASGLLGSGVWGESRRERIAGIPASAPLFDPIQKVRSQPRIDGCMSIRIGLVDTCRCNAVGGARLELSVAQCQEFVRKGWFDETREYGDAKAADIALLNSLRGNAGAAADLGAANGTPPATGTGGQ